MDLPAELDRLVKRTGLFRVTMIEGAEPRSMRWIPLLVLVALAVAYALLLSASGQLTWQAQLQRSVIGCILIWMAFLAGYFLRFLGPRLVQYGPKRLDERELILSARAGKMSGVAISVFAMAGCFYMGIAPFLRLGVPDTTLEWVMLGIAIQAVYFTLPVLIASWIQPKMAEEE